MTFLGTTLLIGTIILIVYLAVYLKKRKKRV